VQFTESQLYREIWGFILFATIIIGFFAYANKADATTIFSQAVKAEINEVCTNNCGTFIGSKFTRTQSTTTEAFTLSTTSVLYYQLSVGIENDYHSFVSGIEANINFNTGCTFSASTSANQTMIDSLIDHDDENPAILTIPLYYNSGTCGTIATSTGFNINYGGGNWNGGIYSLTNLALRPYQILSTTPNPDSPFYTGIQPTYKTKFITQSLSATSTTKTSNVEPYALCIVDAKNCRKSEIRSYIK